MNAHVEEQRGAEIAALALRLGLGIVFVIGGANKLNQLMDPATHDGLVASYTGTTGYINSFFLDYLFSGRFSSWLTADFFLTLLSSFEFVTGLLLVAGLAVRPVSLIYGFLLWSFVMALPVVTAPGVSVEEAVIHSPAILVQIRDIGLSGMMFVLFGLGAGAYSLDRRWGLGSPDRGLPSWDNLGLLLRLSVGLIFLVGGAFAGLDHIQSFATPGWVLFILGLLLVSGFGVRVAGYAVAAVILWYLATKLSLDKSLIANLNGIKRELALLVAGGLLGWLGGGAKFTINDLVRSAKSLIDRSETKTG